MSDLPKILAVKKKSTTRLRVLKIDCDLFQFSLDTCSYKKCTPTLTSCTMIKLVGLVMLLAAITVHAFSPSHQPQGYLRSNRLQQLFAEYQSSIDSCNAILTRAATTKDEDPDQVFEALSNLEKLMREKCRAEADAAQSVLDKLNGSWRLVFSTYQLCSN